MGAIEIRTKNKRPPKLPEEERASLEKATEILYFSDPVLFTIYCSLEQRDNILMPCIARYYKGTIEVNPLAFDYITNRLLVEELAAVCCRIILNHTAERKPDGVSDQVLAIASDMVLHGFYSFLKKELHDMMQYPEGQDLAWYAYRVQSDANLHQKPLKINLPSFSNAMGDGDNNENGDGNSSSSSDDNDSGNGKSSSSDESSDAEGKGGNEKEGEEDEEEDFPLSEETLQGKPDKGAMEVSVEGWEEDPYLREKFKQVIQEAILSGKGWGSVSGQGVERLKALLEPQVNYKEMLSGFRTSIIHSERILTRMRPNRRTGFLNPGSRRDTKSRLLVAVDTSGSVASQSLKGFYSILNGIFKYNGAEVDVVQFDYGIVSEIEPLTRVKDVEVHGRGGTNFQAPVDLIMEKNLKYDGLLYFTDGEAPLPTLPPGFPAKIMWLLDSKRGYDTYKDKFRELGQRVAWMDLSTELARVNL